MHELGVVHRDLTLGNMMLDDNLDIKIIDFAFSCLYHATGRLQKLTDFVGTAPYIAPEIIEGAPYVPYPAEVFALGVCLHLMIYGKNPFEVASEDDPSYC